VSSAQSKPSAAPGLSGLKNARYAQFAVILVAVLALWAGFVFLLSSDKKPKVQSASTDPGKVAVKAITAPGEVVTDAQRWLYKAGDDISTLKGRVKESESLNKELQARLAALEAEAKNKPTASASAKPYDFPPGTPSNPGQGQPGPKFIPPPVSNTPPTGVGAQASTLLQPALPPPPKAGIGHVSLATAPVPGAGGRVTGLAPGAAVSATVSSTTAPTSKGAVAGALAKEREAGKSFLPIGLVKAKLLGGLDAPTAGAAQSSPLPVFMRLEDLAWLPNHWRGNVKDCLVTAAGYGDLSSERAYFRLEKLSCVRQDGRVLEQNISGSVYGEDGKLGLRGRLVTKQGQILANALLAGVVSGIGRGVVYQSSTVGTTALGTVVTDPDPGMEYQSGIGQGVSNAMDRLAQYYIALADKTHPIIEIDAGRLVDLGFTKGTALDVPLPEDPDLLAMRSGPRNGPRRVVE
jgi:conjugal transfer pilus assembly protein TraB